MCIIDRYCIESLREAGITDIAIITGNNKQVIESHFRPSSDLEEALEKVGKAKELADIYYKAGFEEVVAKAGVHSGTFKVFVNFMPVADITYLVPELYKNLLKKGVNIAGIRYCPPNYLRMLM